MLPLFVPQRFEPDKLLRALIGVALFASAYMAEVVRGGLIACAARPVRGGARARSRLLAHDGARDPAAGVARSRCRTSSTPSSACSRTRRWSSSSAFSISCARSRPRAAIRIGRRRRPPSPAMRSPRCSISPAAMACRATREAWKRGCSAPTGGEGIWRWHSKPPMRIEPPADSQAGGRDRRRPQMVRRISCAARHQPEGRCAANASSSAARPAAASRRCLRCINRLEDWQRGRIIVDGIELTDDPKQIVAVRRDVGMVFQQFNLFPHLTVLENCTLAPIWVRHMPQARRRSAGDDISRARQDPRAGRQISGAACPAASSSAWRSRGRCA